MSPWAALGLMWPARPPGLVLADDNLATLTTAVRVGRLLYENLHKAVRYYLAAKVGLIVAALLAVLFRLPVPFSPIQIIVLELFMDLGASVTFTAERPESDLMRRPPRSPQEPFINRAMLVGILAGGWRWRRPCSWLLAGRGVRVWKPPRR